MYAELQGALVLVLAGLGIATAAMGIGIGGGILWTPLLIIGYGVAPSEAVALSLLIQVFGLGSGSVAYLRRRLVETRLALTFAAVALPGVILGAFFTASLKQQQVQLALGLMAMTLAFLFVASQEEAEERHPGATGYDHSRVRQILPVPAFFGVMMGMLSVGIGEWILPLLKHRLRLEMRHAIGTVVLMMFVLALCAGSMHAYFAPELHWSYVLYGAIGTLIGAQLGPYLNQYIGERVLKESFIYLMTLIGIHLIFQAV